VAALVARLERIAEISTGSVAGADASVRAVKAQIDAVEALSDTSTQLAALAERLRAGVARFSVMHPDQTTAEHRAVRRSRP
jgi:hypothetical protein